MDQRRSALSARAVITVHYTANGAATKASLNYSKTHH